MGGPSGSEGAGAAEWRRGRFYIGFDGLFFVFAWIVPGLNWGLRAGGAGGRIGFDGQEMFFQRRGARVSIEECLQGTAVSAFEGSLAAPQGLEE